jgi:hypothetical protein
MDVKEYFRQLNKKEKEIQADHVLVKSRETEDGGRPGIISEVSRRNACRLILEGRAELLSDEEAEQWREQQQARREQFQLEVDASKVRVQVVAASPLPPTIKGMKE